MSYGESGPVQIDRQVLFTKESDKPFLSKDYWVDMDNAVDSDDICHVPDRHLRLALELADIAQALGFPEPETGGYPGGVIATIRTPGVYIGRPEQVAHVSTDFPDDLHDRFNRWHSENH